MKGGKHIKRSFKTGQAMHVVLSSHVSVFSQNRVKQITDSLLVKYANYFEVKVYHRAAVGSHMHLVVLAPSSHALAGFLRVVCGELSAKLRRLGILSQSFGNLWKSRPWSRVISWGRNYTTAAKYVALNYLEGIRAIKRRKSATNLRDFANEIQEVLKRKLTVPEKL